MGYDFKKVVACLVSHEHQDHCKGLAGLIKETAVDVYATHGTIQGLESVSALKGKINAYRTNGMILNRCYSVDGWELTSFSINHEGLEPSGFLIKSETGERILFATDTNYIEYRFNNLSHIIIEANYKEEILQESDYLETIKTRIRESHMEINQTINFIKISKERSDDLIEIILIHTSSVNGDPEAFRKQIERETGVITRIAIENESSF